MALTLTPIYTDNFTPNANPLNPANWSVLTNAHITAVAMQAVSGVCESTVADGTSEGDMQLIGASIPNDCYVSFTNAGSFGTLGNFQTMIATLRTDTAFANFQDSWDLNLTDNGDGSTVTLSAAVQYNNGSNSLEIYKNSNYVPVVNDVYTLAVIGNIGYFFLNGVFKAGRDCSAVNPRTSGPVTLVVFAPTVVTAPSLKTFVAGSASGSIPLSSPPGDLGPGYDFRLRM